MSDELEIPYTDDPTTLIVEAVESEGGGWYTIKIHEGYVIADPVGPFPDMLTAMASMSPKLHN